MLLVLARGRIATHPHLERRPRHEVLPGPTEREVESKARIALIPYLLIYEYSEP